MNIYMCVCVCVYINVNVICIRPSLVHPGIRYSTKCGRSFSLI